MQNNCKKLFLKNRFKEYRLGANQMYGAQVDHILFRHRRVWHKYVPWIVVLKLLEGKSVIITILSLLYCQFFTTKAFCGCRINLLLYCSHKSFMKWFLKEKVWWWLLLINRHFSPNRINYIWYCVWLNMGKYIFGTHFIYGIIYDWIWGNIYLV